MAVFFQPSNLLLSQHISRNNYSGNWATPASWSPEWALPQNVISGYDITINGYITSYNPLSFTGSASNLIINDTLVIIGNLRISNNNNILINNNGILIVKGNLIMENQSSVISNGYFIVTGNLTKTSSLGQGSFTSNDNPVKVFIGGSITPADIVNDKNNFPVLNCSAAPTTHYPNSSCSYGNATDFANDPLYPFYLTVCSNVILKVTSPASVCSPATVDLTAPQVTAGSTPGLTLSYWTDPAATISCSGPSAVSAGTYYIKGSLNGGCFDVEPVKAAVTISPVPIPGHDQYLNAVFETQMAADLGPDQTGEWSLVSGSGFIFDRVSPVTKITGLQSGKNIFSWTVHSGNCKGSANVIINVSEIFVPSVITPNGDGKNDYFIISAPPAGHVELVILNRWGNTEYSNNNYLNEWDGRNNKGIDLANDTYYYILKFGNGQIEQGTVLITR